MAAGTNLLPFLTVVTSSLTNATFLVPNNVSWPAAPFTLTCVVVDNSGIASNPVPFSATVRPFSDALRPFETNVNSQQVWFLDFSRDVESFTTGPASGGGIAVSVVAGANGRSDFEDLLRILGLNNELLVGGDSINAQVISLFETLLLGQIGALYAGANVTFTLTQPAGSFNGQASVSYAAVGFSRISIAGSSTNAGVLGIAIFDPSNTTQNDNTLIEYLGVRLGVFLHTLVDDGLRSSPASLFRQTYAPFAPSLGGTPIGEDAQDGQRLAGTLVDARSDDIDLAIAALARFTAVVTAHECGHSMGLVQNGAMPVGLYGNDTTNFPGSSNGHIRTAFPVGSIRVNPRSIASRFRPYWREYDCCKTNNK
jgi:hypothetical protein